MGLEHGESGPDMPAVSMRAIYDKISAALDNDSRSVWLHAGYSDDDAPGSMSTPRRPWGVLHADHARLIDLLVGEANLEGFNVGDVGCGRGGTLLALGRWFDLQSSVGLDLSGAAVRSNQRRHGSAGRAFVQGDAMSLPFVSGQLDALFCVESAGHYLDRMAFYRETARVVRPGGSFFYADGMSEAEATDAIEALADLGFTLRQCVDASAGVRRWWESFVSSRVASQAARGLNASDAAIVGADNDSMIGDLLAGDRYRYLLMRFDLCDAGIGLEDAADALATSPEAVSAVVRPHGIGNERSTGIQDVSTFDATRLEVTTIMEAYVRSTWLDAQVQRYEPPE